MQSEELIGSNLYRRNFLNSFCLIIQEAEKPPRRKDQGPNKLVKKDVLKRVLRREILVEECCFEVFSLFGIPQESQLVREHLVTAVKIKFKEKEALVSCDQCILFAGIFLAQATPDPLLLLE